MKDILQIESVQRKFTERMPGLSGLTYYSSRIPFPAWGRGLVPWAHLSRPKPAYDRFSRFCTIHRVDRTHTTISATLVAIGHIWHPAIHGEMRGKTNITQKSEETIWVIRNALGECTLAALDDRGSSKSAHILGLNRCQQVVLMSRRQDLGFEPLPARGLVE